MPVVARNRSRQPRSAPQAFYGQARRRCRRAKAVQSRGCVDIVAVVGEEPRPGGFRCVHFGTVDVSLVVEHGQVGA